MSKIKEIIDNLNQTIKKMSKPTVVESNSTAYKSTRAKKSQLIRLRDELLEKEKKNG